MCTSSCMCPGCGANDVGKNKRTLHELCVEHAWSDQNSVVKNHLDPYFCISYFCKYFFHVRDKKLIKKHFKNFIFLREVILKGCQ